MLEQFLLTSWHASVTRLSVSLLSSIFLHSRLPRPSVSIVGSTLRLRLPRRAPGPSSLNGLCRTGKRDVLAHPVNHEIEILRLIHSPPNTLPTLLFHSDAFDEFGISPCGYCPKPGDQIIPWDIVRTNVLHALQAQHHPPPPALG